MRPPRRGPLVLAAMVGAVLTLILPTAASAAYYGSETDYAVFTSLTKQEDYSPGIYCADYGGRVCFKPYGDLLYVLDDSADGFAVVAEWKTSTGRTGACVDKLTASSYWTVCNKNFPEDSVVHWRAALYDNGQKIRPDANSEWFGAPASG